VQYYFPKKRKPAMQPTVKTIGVNGQISLGKRHAGQQVLIEEREAGVWLIRAADVIPHNERRLHDPEHKARLAAAMRWATENTASDLNGDAVLERLAGQENKGG
jgi:putative transposon-encoded protein